MVARQHWRMAVECVCQVDTHTHAQRAYTRVAQKVCTFTYLFAAYLSFCAYSPPTAAALCSAPREADIHMQKWGNTHRIDSARCSAHIGTHQNIVHACTDSVKVP